MTSPAATPAASRSLLVKEVKYRASYRGTLELDCICRSLLPHIDEMEDAELASVAALLQQPEGKLMDWLVEAKPVPDEWQLTVSLVRHYFKTRSSGGAS